jgi:hypothetical protein
MGPRAGRREIAGPSSAIAPAFDHLPVGNDSYVQAYERPSVGRDRLIVASLDGIARRHARWGAVTEAGLAAGAAELQEVAGNRPDLLAEVAGISLGAASGKGPEYAARAQAIAALCRRAGADEDLIPQWIEEGRRRVEARRMPPFSTPGRRKPPRSG